jgi:hypothetical protein
LWVGLVSVPSPSEPDEHCGGTDSTKPRSAQPRAITRRATPPEPRQQAPRLPLVLGLPERFGSFQCRLCGGARGDPKLGDLGAGALALELRGLGGIANWPANYSTSIFMPLLTCSAATICRMGGLDGGQSGLEGGGLRRIISLMSDNRPVVGAALRSGYLLPA